MKSTEKSVTPEENVLHTRLPCGAEFVAVQLPERRAQAVEIRMLTGVVDEPEDRLGLANLVEETLDKGTAHRDGRAISDAYDALGASVSSWCGREASGYSFLCLPEFVEPALAIQAECLRMPAFPEESCTVALSLARQELLTLEDDPGGLADKLINRQAFGPLLGRHVGGEMATLENLSAGDFQPFWAEHYRSGRMVVATAGPLEPQRVADLVEAVFAGFGPAVPDERPTHDVGFERGHLHWSKDTEQQHIVLALPGVAVPHEDFPALRILIGIFSGGMSGRLFTEVREKQGLVYSVSSWTETPRGAGMIFLAASTRPDRCDQTYATLVRELQRVANDIQGEEIERALAGIRVRADVYGDMTRVRCSRAAEDVLQHGRPVPWPEKLARLEAVTVDQVRDFGRRYLDPGRLSVVTLGSRNLDLGLPAITPPAVGAAAGQAAGAGGTQAGGDHA